MAVPKSERKPSDVEYLIILQDLEFYFINQLEQEKSYIKGLTEELVRLSMEAYNNATMFFELTSGKLLGTFAERKKYCKKTYYTAREIASQINIIIKIRMTKNQNVKGLVMQTEKLLKVCELMQKNLIKLNKKQSEEDYNEQLKEMQSKIVTENNITYVRRSGK